MLLIIVAAAAAPAAAACAALVAIIANCPRAPFSCCAAPFGGATASVELPLHEHLQLVAVLSASDTLHCIVVNFVRWQRRANRLPATGRIRNARSVIRQSGKGE